MRTACASSLSPFTAKSADTPSHLISDNHPNLALQPLRSLTLTVPQASRSKNPHAPIYRLSRLRPARSAFPRRPRPPSPRQPRAGHTSPPAFLPPRRPQLASAAVGEPPHARPDRALPPFPAAAEL